MSDYKTMYFEMAARWIDALEKLDALTETLNEALKKGEESLNKEKPRE